MTSKYSNLRIPIGIHSKKKKKNCKSKRNTKNRNNTKPQTFLVLIEVLVYPEIIVSSLWIKENKQLHWHHLEMGFLQRRMDTYMQKRRGKSLQC